MGGSVWTQPSPSDVDRWVAKLVLGEEPSAAAKSLGFTCSAFRRTYPELHAEALEISREARAAYADERAEEWANEPDADHRMRELWLARWNAAYRRSSDVKVSGELEVSSDIGDALEKLAEIVSGSVARADLGDGAERVPELVERRPEGAAGLPVAGVAGTS